MLPTVLLATRFPGTPAASAVFCLEDVITGDAVTLRHHILRYPNLYLRVMASERRAQRWVLGADGALGSNHEHMTLPALDGNQRPSHLYAYLPGEERVVDLSDAASVTRFFLDLYKSKSVWGVRVCPVLVDVGIPRPSNRSSRAMDIARVPPVPLSSVVSSAPVIPSPVVGSASTPFVLGGDGRTPSKPPVARSGRRRVAWSFGGGEGASNAASMAVGALPRDLVLPTGLSVDELRVASLLRLRTNVFLTGAPGSGKTHLLRRVGGALRAAGAVVSTCGSSGMAAALAGGITAHSWAGFIHGHADVTMPLTTLVETVIPRAAKARMRATMVLIIDEVGTLSAGFIDRLDAVLRNVRGVHHPFGGVVTLFSGDFLQLSPPFGNFAFTSSAWRKAFGNKAVRLSTNYRHVEDPVLLQLLLRLRVGKHTEQDIALLASRRAVNPPASAVCLTTHGALARSKNREELGKLDGPDVEFHAVDDVSAPYLSPASASVLLDDCSGLARHLTLRVGAVVVLSTNSLLSRGIPAGSRGKIGCFVSVGHAQYPVVKFCLSEERTERCCVTPTTVHVPALDGINCAASRTQVPLTLGWASTIHSAQGWTVPQVALDLKGAFAAGQVLSAVSRTPRLTGIHLMSFDSDKIIVDALAVQFDACLVPL